MALLTLALWAGGVLAAICVVPFLATTHRFLRARFQPIRWTRTRDEALPEPVQALFRRAIGELAPLGFEAVSMTLQSSEIVGAPSASLLCLLHRDGVTWALVGFSLAPSAGAPLRLVLVTSFEDESTLTTVSGEAWAHWSRERPQRVLDTHRAHWHEQLRDHVEAVAATRLETMALDLSDLLAREERSFSQQLATLRLVDASSPESAYYLPARAILKLAWRARFPSKALRQLRRAQQRLPAWEPEYLRALPLVQAHQCDVLRAIVKSPPRHCPAWVLLVIGSVFIPLVFVPWRPLSKVSQLMVVLLIHELGRWLVLRFVGDCAPGLFPIPFFDVVTAGPMRDGSFWKRFLIHAAGPVPGVIAGALALSIVSSEHETIRALATTAVAINAAHLLPAMPLDGGRLVQHLAAGVHPRLELALGFLGVIALTGLTLVAQHPVLVLLLVATVLSTDIPYYSARAALQLRHLVSESDEQLSSAINTVVLTQKIQASAKPAIALRAFERLRSAGATPVERTLGWLCYLALLTIAVASVASAYASKIRPKIEIACHDVAAYSFPTSTRFETMTCEPEAGAQLHGVLADLELLEALPTELCLREPWIAAVPPSKAPREQRARQTVRELALEADKQEPFDFREGVSDQEVLAGIAAQRRAALNAVERLQQARSRDPDFDVAAAAAYVAYLRVRVDPSAASDSATASTLQALLGARGACPAPYRVVSASITKKKKRLHVTTWGDPTLLARHLCASGCRALSIRRRDQAEPAGR